MEKRLLVKFSPKTYAIYYKNGVATFSCNDWVLFKANSHEENGVVLDFIPESQSILLKTKIYPEGIPVNPAHILRKTPKKDEL